MYHLITELAIPQGYTPPTQLPAEFHNCLKVFEIVDSHLPGYVYLRFRYLLTQSVDVICVKYDDRLIMYAGNRVYGDDKKNIHGPAVHHARSPISSLLSVDNIRCMQCPWWPTQAADWPTRHRNYVVGQTQQLLIALSTTDVMWLQWLK